MLPQLSPLLLATLASAVVIPNLAPNNTEALDKGWIPALYAQPQSFPNCGIAGVSCGKSNGFWYCAPHGATCCVSEYSMLFTG